MRADPRVLRRAQELEYAGFAKPAIYLEISEGGNLSPSHKQNQCRTTLFSSFTTRITNSNKS